MAMFQWLITMYTNEKTQLCMKLKLYSRETSKVHFHGYSVFDKNIPFQSRFLIVIHYVHIELRKKMLSQGSGLFW